MWGKLTTLKSCDLERNVTYQEASRLRNKEAGLNTNKHVCTISRILTLQSLKLVKNSP